MKTKTTSARNIKEGDLIYNPDGQDLVVTSVMRSASTGLVQINGHRCISASEKIKTVTYGNR